HRDLPADPTRRSSDLAEDTAAMNPHAPQEDELRTEAVRKAREYLPKLGELNTRRIMAFILEGIERGAFDLDNSTIAEALGLSLRSEEHTSELQSRGHL